MKSAGRRKAKAKCHPDRDELRDGQCSSCYVVSRRRLKPRDYLRLKLKKYGIRLHDYDLLMQKQGGVCAICLRPPTGDARLGVDHCHSSGVVRGLLCRPCNNALGHLEDDVDRLRRAADYLERSRTEHVVPDLKWAATDSRLGRGRSGLPRDIMDVMTVDRSVIWTPAGLARRLRYNYVLVANAVLALCRHGRIERVGRGRYRLSPP